ncbi:MAG: sigma 54-interacting transcriptional regulator [Sphaerochaetaceae bacterium]|nr:sigma 54-interacting transcriptional regulator [Sphaerochaetaceae bacterium]MDD4218682.1 sigma 54-interacting transcriptional regulator [Sphaerochaetaceae bacterium]
MSLFLITKDVRLRATINRQLRKGCYSATSLDQIKKLRINLALDTYPVLLIDEKFSEQGLLPILDYIVSTQVPGPKIIITSKKGINTKSPFVYDSGIGILYKPFSIEQLIALVVDIGGVPAIAPHLCDSQLSRILDEYNTDWHALTLIGQSKALVKIRNIIKKIGPVFSSVHINGETGTGKEVVASLLCQASGCADPYIIVNCSSIPETLADTYIFGNVKGAFTDAKIARKGVVKSADGGVLFLDEIEDLAKGVQGKLLRLLETKQFRPIGSDFVETSHFKLITASNQPLKELSNTGKLRFDLLNRLNRLVIHIPPLRERKEDIPLLIDHYLKEHGEERRPDEPTMAKIMEYQWPGNTRELFKELEQLSVFASHSAQSLSYREILTESVLK